jgi:hypothetical protein
MTEMDGLRLGNIIASDPASVRVNRFEFREPRNLNRRFGERWQDDSYGFDVFEQHLAHVAQAGT